MTYIANAQDPLLPRDSKGALKTDTILEDRYCILKTLGMGGMGAVYKARDQRFPNVRRMVAVKEMQTLSPDPETREVIIKSFEREANNLAELDHPAIPKIYDYFNIHDRVYLVMEYIQGRDLETILQKTPGSVKVETVYEWAVDLCDVLYFLHSHKPDPIVFRDVKPANIMIDQHHNLRLIDFGIAKTFETGHKGTLVGSPGYAPPEQYRGEASPSGDIYALGGTLHHLLTKTDPRLEKPFTFNERPIRKFNPNVSEEFARVIMRALAYEPEERYIDAALMKAALEQVGPVHGEVAKTQVAQPHLVPPPPPDTAALSEKAQKAELNLIMKRSPLLKALMKAAPEVMMAALKDECYTAGTVLFRQGDPGDRVYAIWSGLLRVQLEMGEGAPPLVVDDRGPGDMVGEMSLLEDQPRSATLVVVEDARLVSLSREDFQRLLVEPEINMAVLRTLSQRLRAVDEQFIEASRSVEFLAKRMSGVLTEEPLPPADGGALAIQAPQWEGLNTLFRYINDSTEDVLDGLKLLRVELPPDLDDAAEDLLGLLRGNIRRMSTHLSRIWDWQQLESGATQLEQQAVTVGETVEKVITRLTPSARMFKLTFNLSVASDLPAVEGDEEWLSRALTEVIQNAMNHAPPETTIDIKAGMPERGELQISVADQGPGVPTTYRELIFEPFVRAPNAEGNGLGLGLALCRAIVQAHGGRVWVEDGPQPGGQGSIFFITLPVGADTVADPTAATQGA